MNYLDMTSRYYTLTMKIGYLEKQIARGDKDLELVRELAFLRDEQKRVAKAIDDYNAKYETETWRVD